MAWTGSRARCAAARHICGEGRGRATAATSRGAASDGRDAAIRRIRRRGGRVLGAERGGRCVGKLGPGGRCVDEAAATRTRAISRAIFLQRSPGGLGAWGPPISGSGRRGAVWCTRNPENSGGPVGLGLSGLTLRVSSTRNLLDTHARRRREGKCYVHKEENSSRLG
jgi:hypothetical protein